MLILKRLFFLFLLFLLAPVLLRGQTEVGTISIPTGEGFGRMAANPAKTEVYVVRNDILYSIDIRSRSLRATLPLGAGSRDSCVAVSRSGLIGIATWPRSIAIFVDPFTLVTQRLSTGLVVGGGCAFGTDGLFYATADLRDSPEQFKVSIIDPQMLRVTQLLKTDDGSIPFAVSLPDGRVYLGVQYLPLSTGWLLVLEKKAEVKITRIDLPIIPMAQLAVSPEPYNRLYITGSDTKVVNTLVFDTATNRIIGSATTSYNQIDFPDVDPWFAWIAWGESVRGYDFFHKAVAALIPTSGQNSQAIQVVRQTDGSDLLVVLQNSRVVFLKATAPPLLYDVVNGASFNVGPVSPGSLVSAFGSSLSFGLPLSANSLPLPTRLGSTYVLVGERPAPLLYISASQINFQVPFEVSPVARYSIRVVRNDSGAQSPTLIINTTPTSPASFLANGAIILTRPDGSLVTRERPAISGELLTLWATGLGAVNPFVQTGAAAPSSPLSRIIIPLEIMVSRVNTVVEYAGLAPGFAGLYQVNFRIPEGVISGEATVVLTQGGASSPVYVFPFALTK